jgi:hypothetical protein
VFDKGIACIGVNEPARMQKSIPCKVAELVLSQHFVSPGTLQRLLNSGLASYTSK